MLSKIIVLCVLLIYSTQAYLIRIIGGHEAERGSFKYQVSLQYGILKSHVHLCGGSVLNSRWILTAGHCITIAPKIRGAKFFVLAGIHNLKDKGHMVEAKRSVVHPDFPGGADPHDIALIEMAEELVLGDDVKAVALPKKDSIYIGPSTFSGWGSISNKRFKISPTNLQTVDLPVITYKECEDALIAIKGSSYPLGKTNLCTGPLKTGGKAACAGDSGGPLVTNDGKTVQIGIASWGLYPCGYKGSVTVFARVSAFIDFINQYVQ